MSQSDVSLSQETPGLKLSSGTRKFLLLLTLTLVCAIIYSALITKRQTNSSLDCTFTRAVRETIKLFNELKEVL